MGLEKTCKKFARTSSGVFRCKKFKYAKTFGKHPKHCPPGMTSRSRGLIHLKVCVPHTKGSKAAPKKRKSQKRTPKR